MKMRVAMKMSGWLMAMVSALTMLAGCEGSTGPELEGEITLSSQLYGTESYFLYGYNFEDSEMYRFPSQGDPLPDMINEGFPLIEGGKEMSLPGFNTPGRVNGFALLGEFSSLNEAEEFYGNYQSVEEGLQYESVSDTVKRFQVWIQKTSAGTYAKMLIREIYHAEGGTGVPYNEVLLKYHYSNDGSATF
jgi:hypothetical protein